MRIACLSTRYHVAGASINAALLARGFAEQGSEAEAWFVYRAGEMPKSGVRERIFLTTAPSAPSNWTSLYRNYRQALLEFRPDAIIAFHPLANALGSLAKLISPHRFIATQRNPSDTQGRILRIADWALGCSPLYDSNVCVSESVRGTFSGYPSTYRKKLTVIHNGLRPLPRVDDDRDSARTALGLPLQASLVGTMGRLHYQKNIEFLLDVALAANSLHFAIGGEGPEAERLHATVRDRGLSDRVHFVGNVEGEDVTRFFRAIDVFALPSRYEGFGLTLIESMSEGTPVVCSDIPTLREVGGDAAEYCEFNPSRWSATLTEIATHSDRRTAMIALGHDRAREFTAHSMIQRYLQQVSQTIPNA